MTLQTIALFLCLFLLVVGESCGLFLRGAHCFLLSTPWKTSLVVFIVCEFFVNSLSSVFNLHKITCTWERNLKGVHNAHLKHFQNCSEHSKPY